MASTRFLLLRYPGGKQRFMKPIIDRFPPRRSIEGQFVEPFVGGGSVFFAFNPKRSLLTDLNLELIELYQGLKRNPKAIWAEFRAFPATKRSYYKVRAAKRDNLDLTSRAARTLYLNRTCFKGMWRHNLNGQFNVGYGGQSRRWVIAKRDLIQVSKRLKRAKLRCSDYEAILDSCSRNDFVFLDPPYRPGERDLLQGHYVCSTFCFDDHRRLATVLYRATRRGVR